ncbi:MAG: hypothetical protein GXP25_06880 [Planctomycetes bacterium]|nr:hypothetical protein [Planctomycetota bacterium]
MLPHGPRGLFLKTVVFLLCCLSTSKAWACPYTVRDVGYSSWNRGTYTAYLFTKDDSPESRRLAESFRALSHDIFADANVKAAVVPPEKRDDHKAAPYLIDLGIDAFPAIILVSPDDRALKLCGSEAGGFSEKELRSKLSTVVSSPAREELEMHCIREWCIALLVSGSSDKANTAAEGQIDAANKEVAGTTTATGRVMRNGAHRITVSAEDPKEQVLLWSLQLDRPSAKPRVVILYGRGQQIGPVLEGDGITKANLVMVYEALGRNCSCTADPSLWSGPSIPMPWSEVRRMELRETYGFDPDSPRFRSAVAAYVPGAAKSSDFVRGIIGYSEGYVEYTEPPDAPTVAMPTVEPQPAAVVVKPRKTSTLERNTGYTVFYVIGGMTLLVAVAGSILAVWRMRVS